MICAGFRKTNMVKFALGDKLSHDAGALLDGDAMDNTCRLEKVKFLGSTELGEDKVDPAFESGLPATQILNNH